MKPSDLFCNTKCKACNKIVLCFNIVIILSCGVSGNASSWHTSTLLSLGTLHNDSVIIIEPLSFPVKTSQVKRREL